MIDSHRKFSQPSVSRCRVLLTFQTLRSGSPSNLRHLEKSDTIELHPPQQDVRTASFEGCKQVMTFPPLLKNAAWDSSRFIPSLTCRRINSPRILPGFPPTVTNDISSLRPENDDLVALDRLESQQSQDYQPFSPVCRIGIFLKIYRYIQHKQVLYMLVHVLKL